MRSGMLKSCSVDIVAEGNGRHDCTLNQKRRSGSAQRCSFPLMPSRLLFLSVHLAVSMNSDKSQLAALGVVSSWEYE
jgi:hypothetical protein